MNKRTNRKKKENIHCRKSNIPVILVFCCIRFSYDYLQQGHQMKNIFHTFSAYVCVCVVCVVCVYVWCVCVCAVVCICVYVCVCVCVLCVCTCVCGVYVCVCVCSEWLYTYTFISNLCQFYSCFIGLYYFFMCYLENIW